jgi:Purple acid Phosphatase, N-terminal domain
MNRLFPKLAITAAVTILLFPNPGVAQFHPQNQTPPPDILPPQKRAEHVEITKAPELESANSWKAIVRWTTTNPRGLDEHYGVVFYGTSPEDLSGTARGHIRLNRGHPETMFRVRLEGLEPKTTYYYRVTSVDSDGKSDGVESDVSHFTTPAPGDVINNFPPKTQSK